MNKLMRYFAHGLPCTIVLLWPKLALASCNGSGLFGLCNSQDQASQWLDYLFFGKNIVDSSGYPIPQATIVQAALRSALSVYSGAVLVLAGVILLYHLLEMVAETAHTGKPMGRANQIYAPIRLVLAIGFLVPMAGGLNVGQNMMVHVAKWGSNLASHVWLVFLDNLAASSPVIIPPSVPPIVNKVVHDLVMMKACTYVYNSELDVLYGDQAWVKQTYIVSFQENSSGGSFKSTSEKAVCGSYTLPTPNASTQQVAMVNRIYACNKATIQNMVKTQGVDALAKKILHYASPNADTPAPTKEEYDALVNQYWTALYQGLQQAANDTSVQNTIAQLASNWSADGWVGAGAWFNTISRVQSNILDANEAALPRTSPPDMDFLIKQDRKTNTWRKTPDETFHGIVGSILGQFDDAIGGGEQSTNPLPEETTAAASGTNDGKGSSGNPLLAVFDLVDWIGQKTGSWPSTDGVLFPFKTSNPLSELAYLGHNNLSTGLMLIAIGGVSPIASKSINYLGDKLARFIPVPAAAWLTSIFSGVLSTVIEQFGWLCITIGCGFVFTGVLLSFALPMIPFIRFFFNVLVWLLTVFEAVIAMPLFALAHLNPYGDGVAPSSAKGGYFFMLSIMLRPVLMIFGLMAGLLLFFVAIVFLNKMFLIATAGTGASAGGYGTLAKIIFSVMYATLAYICANTCFKAISHFPDHALNWMGGRGPQTKDLGDPSTMQSVVTATAGYMGSKGLAGISGLGEPLAKNVRTAAQIYADKQQHPSSKPSNGKPQEGTNANRNSALSSNSSMIPKDGSNGETANSESSANNTNAYNAHDSSNETPHAAKAGFSGDHAADYEQSTDSNTTTQHEQTHADTSVGFSGNDANNPPPPDLGTNIPTNHASPGQYQNTQIIHSSTEKTSPFIVKSDDEKEKESKHTSAKVPFDDKNIPHISDR